MGKEESNLRQLKNLNRNIIEFVPKGAKSNNWTLLLDHKTTAKKNIEASIHQFNNRLREALKRFFTESTKLTSNYWEKSFDKLSEAGFYIPKSDLNNLNAETLKDHLGFYTLLLVHFDYKNFFVSLQASIDFLDYEEKIITRLIWIYVFYYSRFLYKLKKKSSLQYKKYNSWFTLSLIHI